MNIRELPENTTGEIRDKLNCFMAEIIEMREKISLFSIQMNIDVKHQEKLFLKLREKILEQHQAKV